MTENRFIFHITIMILSFTSWIFLFISHTKIAVALFFILWAENLSKKLNK